MTEGHDRMSGSPARSSGEADPPAWAGGQDPLSDMVVQLQMQMIMQLFMQQAFQMLAQALFNGAQGDLVFIVIYGLGAWYGGLWFAQDTRPKLRRLGWLLAGTAVVFLATDLTETLAQLVQLARGQGSDGLAALAAIVRPVKMVAWLVTFFAVVAGLVVRRISPSAG